MATRDKVAGHTLKSLGRTFEACSLDSTTIEKTISVIGGEEEDADDGPAVFICVKCKLPVGDTLSWDGAEDSQNQIRLKRLTENVRIGEETRMYEPDKKSPCLVVDLICRGCNSAIGIVYLSTPKKMDHKRFAFCLNVTHIDSYVLGSANQMLAAEGPEEQLVTLEYRGVVEQQLTKMKLMLVSMAQRLEEIESDFKD